MPNRLNLLARVGPFCVLSIAIASGNEARFVTSQKNIAQTILDLDKKWSDAAQGHDLAKTASFYASDAIVLPPNSAICTTKKQILDCWAPMCEKSAEVSWIATKVEVAKAGDMAYTYGTYKLVMPDGKGGMMKDKGKFVEIWMKQSNGQWKCKVDTFNSDLPAS